MMLQSVFDRLKLGFLGLLLVLGLSACSSAPETASVTLWHGVNPAANRDVLQHLVDRYNQSHPEAPVTPIYVGQADQQLPKLFAAAVGHALPDLLWYAPTLTGQLVELEVLKPLDDWLAQLPEARELDPALRESTQLEAQTWSVPFDTNNVGIFYRPSLFKAAGITKLPETWDEFRSIAKRLTLDLNGDGKIDQHGMMLPLGKGEWSVFTWLPFMWSAGGELQSKQNNQSNQSNIKQITVNHPGSIAALHFWRSLLKDGSAILSQPERGYELTSFINGKVAMQISGPWTLGELQQSGADFAVLPIPKPDAKSNPLTNLLQSRNATSIGGENLFVFKSNPDREANALKFAQYVISESFQTPWSIETGYLPVNLKSRESEAYRAFRSQQPAVETFLAQAKVGRSRPISPGYSRISDALGRAIETALLDRSTPEIALKEAQQRLDLIFTPDSSSAHN